MLGLDLNPAQRRWFSLIRPGTRGWEWRYKFVIHVAANQIGKSLGVAVLILWATNYKIGVDTSDQQAWLAAPYNWFHVAPSQQQAYIPLRDIVLLMAGNHPAQRRKPKVPSVFVRFTKVEQYYDGIELWNGASVQFRTTEEKAKALQGRRANGISFDECAFENYLKETVNESLLMRLISTGGPLFLISTPNGINDYYEIVQSVVERGEHTYVEDGKRFDRVWTTDDGWALVWSVVDDNVGYGLSSDEVARMERDLDDSTKEQQLRGAFLEPAEAYFTPPAQVTNAFIDNLPDEQLPEKGHTYAIFWDPSVSSDPTAVIVLDVTEHQWVGVYFRRHKKPLAVAQLLFDMHQLHALYQSNGAKAITGYDATSMGGAMLRQQISNIRPSRPLNFAGANAKNSVLGNLRAALSGGRVVFPKSWIQLQRELLNYRLKDQAIVQDCVMAAAGACDLASRGFSGAISRPFDVSGRTTTLWMNR